MRQRAKHFGFTIPQVVFLLIIAFGFRNQNSTYSRVPASIPGNGLSYIRKIKPGPASGSILGIVVPFSVKTTILVVSVADTVASTFSDTTNGAYILKEVPPGNYALIYLPSDNAYRKTSNRAAVSENQITIADTVWLHK